jgi:hypothetical protein
MQPKKQLAITDDRHHHAKDFSKVLAKEQKEKGTGKTS